MSRKKIIEFRNITKTFPGVTALDNVSFSINYNEIHGLVGENGAGKSALLRIIAGDIANYEGDLILDAKKVSFKNPTDAISSGISVVYQELNLCEDLDVVQNIFLGKEIKKHGRIDNKYMKEKSEECLQNLNIEIDLKRQIKFFNAAQKQEIEIAKASVLESKIVVMDEPTASLNQEEVKKLFNLLLNMKNGGATIIFVSHRLEEIFYIADRISVLRNGRYIGTVNKKKSNLDEIIGMMIGEKLLIGKNVNRELSKIEVLRIENFSREGIFKKVNFSLMKGEILGIAGLEGSGRFSIGRAIFGILPYQKGNIYINTKKVTINNPKDAIKHKIGFLSRDRKGEGILANFDVKDNITIVRSLNDKYVIKNKYVELVKYFLNKLNIKCSSIMQNISVLSGGNQQKCLVSRWLGSDTNILIMEEPTHGIDIGAKAEMQTIVRELADSGKSIITISSELDELLNQCDTIIVMCKGKVVLKKRAKEITKERIMSYATGITN